MNGPSATESGGAPRLRELLAGATTSVGLRLVAVALGFAFTVLLARQLGAAQAGLYLVAFNIVTLLAIASRLGLDDVVVRSVAAERADGARGRLLGVVRTSTGITVATSGALSLLAWVTADWWASRVLRIPEISTPLRILSLAILPLALSDLWGFALRGLSRIRASQWVLFVNTRVLNLAGLVVLGGAWGAVGVGWIAVASAAASVVLAGWLLWRATRSAMAPADAVTAASLLSPGTALFATTLVVMLTDRLSLVALGALGGSADAGIFGTSLRTAGLLSLALHGMEVAVAPRFAALNRSGDFSELRRLAKMATRLITWATVPAVVVVFIFRDAIMRLFGEEFVAGGWALAILVAGQCLYAMGGPASSILVMGGHERIRLAIAATAAIVCLTLSLLLIPTAGLAGAALATALAWGVHGALATFAVYKLRGFWVGSNLFRVG